MSPRAEENYRQRAPAKSESIDVMGIFIIKRISGQCRNRGKLSRKELTGYSSASYIRRRRARLKRGAAINVIAFKNARARAASCITYENALNTFIKSIFPRVEIL